MRDHDADHDVDDERGTGGDEAGALAPSGSTPRDSAPNASSLRNATVTAARVPETSPAQPAVGVIRFQNMPRMNVANSGALKNPNSVCR